MYYAARLEVVGGCLPMTNRGTIARPSGLRHRAISDVPPPHLRFPENASLQRPTRLPRENLV